MASSTPLCSNSVDENIKCSKCDSYRIKNGRTWQGKQRFLCKVCKESKVIDPVRLGFGEKHDEMVVKLTCEGCGIRSIGRILSISGSSVIRVLLRIGACIKQPLVDTKNRIQVDEIFSYVGTKLNPCYVIYSWDQQEKKALSLVVGRRSKVNLRKVVQPLLNADIESINTDRYSGYVGTIPKKKHTTFKRRNNGIERQNLTLRTHIKRLSRRTICFSKSKEVLESILKIYFWKTA